MSRGSRSDCNPIIVDDKGSDVRILERIPFVRGNFDESWLQELIRKTPSVVPSGEFEAVFASLAAIGREVGTAVGPIDNMFISADGYLVLVETTLWRNPEARREVVGQILDYAKEIARWTFEDLDQTVRDYTRKYEGSSMGVIELMKQRFGLTDAEEISMVDSIMKNIRQGRFLLLIIGDGIRESVEDMVEYLNQNPQIQFTLGLVEIKVYRLQDGDVERRLAIPQIVMRTREVTRAVVIVEGGAGANIHIDLPTVSPAVAANSGSNIEEAVFFSELENAAGTKVAEAVRQFKEECLAMGCVVEWKKSSFVVKLSDPSGSRKRLTLLVINKNGSGYGGWLPDQLEGVGLSRSLADGHYSRISKGLFPLEDEEQAIRHFLDRGFSAAEFLENWQKVLLAMRNSVDEISRSGEL